MGSEGASGKVKVLLFGLPISAHRRLKEESADWDGAVPQPHTFRSMPTTTNEYKEYSDGELRELKSAVGEGFTHIVVPASRDWKELHRRLLFDCRIHIARLWEPLRDVKWTDLKDLLHRLTLLDEKWIDKLRPADLRHPLLLPPPIFRTNRKTDKFWGTCDAYAEDRIDRAVRLLDTVEREHRKADGKGGRSWIDENNRRYRFDPAMHGRNVADRSNEKSFRFCYEVPPGFHYDVTDDRDRSFSIEIDGRAEDVKHCNISPWGHVRRG